LLYNSIKRTINWSFLTYTIILLVLVLTELIFKTIHCLVIRNLVASC
jgi:hypothetical protein